MLPCASTVRYCLLSHSGSGCMLVVALRGGGEGGGGWEVGLSQGGSKGLRGKKEERIMGRERFGGEVEVSVSARPPLSAGCA